MQYEQVQPNQAADRPAPDRLRSGDFGGCMTFGLMTAFTTYVMYEAVYAIHVIAFAGLISGMAVNDDERSKISAARGIGGTLGGILPQVLFPRIIEFF